MEGYTWKRFIKDYWYLLRGRKGWFLAMTILRSISDLIPFAVAFILGRIIDFFTSYSRGDPLREFYYYAGAIGLLGAFEVWLRFFSKVRLQTIAAEIRKESRISAMNRIITLDLKWHESEETGSKMQKINQGGESVFQGIKDFSNHGIWIITSLLGSLIIFIALDLRYLAFVVIFIAIYLFAEMYYTKRLSVLQDELNKVREKVSGKMHESGSNILSVKSMGLMDSVGRYAESYEDEFYSIWQRTRDLSQRKFKTVKMFSALAYASFILLLGLDFTKGAITLGSIYVYASYFGNVKGASHRITDYMSEFIAVKSSFGRFMTIFDAAHESEKELKDFPKHWKRIEFQEVNFRYKNRIVLKDFNLIIRRGQKIGIAGKSGCGKSTIVKLILKLYKPSSGKILIDGKELNSFRQASIAISLGVVLQEPEMFNMSLAENIAISAIQPARKKMLEAIKISQLERVVKKLPEGIDTLIGERGYQLSGGERQRVGIARAVYKDSDFLILDEATSALDSRTEERVHSELDRNLKGKTMLIIAHRLSTLRNTDRIILIDKGRVVESGTFRDLTKKRGRFHLLSK